MAQAKHHVEPQRCPRKGGARFIACRCLLRWGKGGVFAETLIAKESQGISAPDRALVQSIVLGTLRHMRWLEHICLTLRGSTLQPEAFWPVLAGLCQIFVLRMPDHAVVSETVNCVPPRLKGLVNALLRTALRRRGALEAESETLPLGVRYSAPDWLVERWQKEFGPQATQAMLAWNVGVPPVYARLNPLNPMQVPADWQPLEAAPGWYRIPSGLPTDALKAGQVYIADPSTRHCITLLNPQPGERILDACAAPGGKSAAMIGATLGDIHLLATDAAPHRLPQLKENLLRAGGLDVQVACHDWTQPCPESMKGRFDAVLLDVPCSNSGVLQRRVDARWRLLPDEFARLASLQSSILEQASAALAPGGRLVYSTCSIDAQEDRMVVDAFLARHPEFEFVQDYLALPHLEQADGAYAALLRLRAKD